MQYNGSQAWITIAWIMPHALAGNRMKKHNDAIAASVEGVTLPGEPALGFVVVDAISISYYRRVTLAWDRLHEILKKL